MWPSWPTPPGTVESLGEAGVATGPGPTHHKPEGFSQMADRGRKSAASLAVVAAMPDLSTGEGLRRYGRLLAMRERETRAITALARSMRLTQQARYDARTANTAANRAGGAPRPWEFGVGCPPPGRGRRGRECTHTNRVRWDRDSPRSTAAPRRRTSPTRRRSGFARRRPPGAGRRQDRCRPR